MAEEKVEVIQGDNLELISPSEIDMQIKTAKAYPRNLAEVKREIIEIACTSQEIAEACFYEIPGTSGRDKITGPSVRMAEIINFCWKNSMNGSRIIEVGQRSVKAQGFFFDLEKNTRTYVEVTRSIINKDGKRFPEHLINTTCMAAMSIAHRNATFKNVPMAYLTDVEKRVKNTAMGQIKDLEKSRRDALDLFLKEYDATKDEVCAYLHVKSIEAIGKDELWSLKKLHTAFKDKHAKPDDVFKRAAGKDQAAASKKAFGEKKDEKKPGKQPTQTTIHDQPST